MASTARHSLLLLQQQHLLHQLLLPSLHDPRCLRRRQLLLLLLLLDVLDVLELLELLERLQPLDELRLHRGQAAACPL